VNKYLMVVLMLVFLSNEAVSVVSNLWLSFFAPLVMSKDSWVVIVVDLSTIIFEYGVIVRTGLVGEPA